MADPSPEVQRILSLLEGIIAFKKVPIGTIENALGVSQGYLARILRGDVHLRYQNILDILEIIGVTPSEFFAIAYAGQGTPDAAVSAFFHRHSAPKLLEVIEREAAKLSEEEVVEKVMKKLVEKGLLPTPPAPENPEDPSKGEGS